MKVCGDGVPDIIPNSCDDHNSLPGDGCSATCMVEAGYRCEYSQTDKRSYCEEICGDGIRTNNTE